MNIYHFLFILLSLQVVVIHAEKFFVGGSSFNYTKIRPFGGGVTATAVNGINIRYGGMAVYSDPVTTHVGFNTSFLWTSSNCTSSVDVYSRHNKYIDGVSIVLSETSLSSQLYRGGFQDLPDTLAIGYVVSLNEFYVCNWNTPPPTIPTSPLITFPPFFRSNCQVFPYRLTSLGCNVAYNFTISFRSDNVISMYVDGRLGFSYTLPSSLRPVARYVGICASSDSGVVANHAFTSWQWDSVSEITEFTTDDTRVSALGQASVDVTAKRIWLTTAQNGAGFVVLRDYVFSLSQQFGLNFKWTLLGSEDQQDDNGFAMFLTSPRSELEVPPGPLSYGSGLGIQSRPGTTIIGFNRARNEFYLCKWTTVISTAFQNFCPTFPNPLPPVGLNQTVSFEVIYNQDLFEVYANNEFVFASTLVLSKSDNYTIGFAGSAGTSNVRQYISEWSKTTTYPSAVNSAISVANLITAGGAAVVSNLIQISNNGVGLAVYKTPQPARLGFTTSFQWKPTNCTSDSGFTFFLTTTPPSDVTVSSINDDAGYGTSMMSRLTSFTVNYTSSQFAAYFNSTMFAAKVYSVPLYLSSTNCLDLMDIKIEYTSTNIINVYFMNQLFATLNDRAKTIINPSLYYLGLSGVEGTFTRWSYSTITLLPKKRQFTYNFNDAVINTLGTASLLGNSLRLTTGGSESGVAYYPLPVYTHTGFYSSLTWTPTNCDAENNGADGFTLFFSKSQPQESEVYLSSGGLLGVGSVPNVTMFAYSATYNEFYICDWNAPLSDNFRYVCSFIVRSSLPKLTCPQSYYFEFSFTSYLRVLVNGTSAFATPVGYLKLDPVPYFVGLSGATGGGYFTQDISNWLFESTTI